MAKTILVTGHAGFIGSHLTAKLLEVGNKVVGVDNYNDFYSPTRKRANVAPFLKNPKFKQYELDILDADGLKRVFEDQNIDTVVHLAARAGVRPSIANPSLYEEVNVKGTLNILETMRVFAVKHLVFGSSSSVYGNQTKVPFTETDPVNQPVSPYAATKKAAEMLGYTYSYLHQLQTTCLRFFTVYGPAGRPDMAPYLFTQKILKGESIIRYGDGSSSRDYTYVDDIVSGITAAVDKPLDFEVINLGNHQPVTLNDFIALIERLTGKKAVIEEAPRNPADVLTTYADIAKAKKLLSWEPKTKLEDGMKQFIDWFKQSA
ncbi:MAG TPA: GDP-mannose 4,6-dehydratase [Patescibacteria group bacterium]|nr:GDP-mannose 4,6-dehydratase [Patescibacteria group bacterium]